MNWFFSFFLFFAADFLIGAVAIEDRVHDLEIEQAKINGAVVRNKEDIMSIQAANRSFLAKIEQAFHDVNGRLAREIRRIDLLAKNDSVFARLFDLVLSASGALLFALVSGGYLAIRIRKSKKCKDCQSEKAE